MIGITKPVVWVAEPDGFSNKAKDLLESRTTVIYKEINHSQLSQIFNLCDVFWFRLNYTIRNSDLDFHQRCKIIVIPVTGLDQIDLEACLEKNILVLSLKGELEFLKDVRATAEHTMALLLSLIRRIIPAVKHTLHNNFDRDTFQGTELYKKTIGIIGFGRLGSIVASYARAFGMKVLIYDINQEKLKFDQNYEYKNLDLLLAESDIVSLHVDLNEGNRKMVNRNFLAKMKKASVLINTSRGALIDELALVEFLKSGHLAGAALDVLNDEPNVNFDSSVFNYFKSHDNLLITPHLGGNTYESFEKTECFLVEKLFKAFENA